MVGVEFTTAAGKPDSTIAEAVQGACLRENLLLLMCGTYRNVIRWIPPLIVNESQIEEGLRIFEAALAEVTNNDMDRGVSK
jgi:4-aminobutyrate aminotransferase-like enzyme